MNSANYKYTLNEAIERSGYEIILTEVASGKTQQFYIADPKVKIEHLRQHMDSLTDDLCSSWFNKKGGKPKKGKKDADDS